MNHRLTNLPSLRSTFTLFLVLIAFGGVAYELRGYPASAQSCASISPGSVDGQIRGSSVACYSFDGSTDEVVTIRMEALPGSGLDPWLELVGPNGRRLTSDDDGGGGRNSLIQFTLPVTGNYTLNAKSYNGGSSGAFRLNFAKQGTMVVATLLRAASLAGVSIRCSCDGDLRTGLNSVTATIARPGRDCVCTFSGSAGDNVKIRMVADSANLDPLLELRDPAGRTLATDDDGAGGRNSLITHSLPSAGTYTIIATSYGRTTSGGFTLSIEGVSASDSACGGSIGYGDTRSGTISSNRTSCEYQFSGRSGDVVDIVMQQTGTSNLDPWLDLRGPNGNVLVSDDDSAGGRNSRIRYRLPSSGTYMIIATSYQGSSIGSFRLTLSLG